MSIPDLLFAAARLRLALVDARAGRHVSVATLDEIADRMDAGLHAVRKLERTLEYIVEDACEDAAATPVLRRPGLVLLQGGRP